MATYRPESPLLPFPPRKDLLTQEPRALNQTDPTNRALKEQWGSGSIRPKDRETADWNSEAFGMAFRAFERDYDRSDDHGGVRPAQLFANHRASLLRAAVGHPLFEELKTALNGHATSPVFEICHRLLKSTETPDALA